MVQRGSSRIAAIDGSPETYWQASEFGPNAWWEVELDAPRLGDEVTVTAGPTDREVVRVRAGDQVTESVTISPGIDPDDPARRASRPTRSESRTPRDGPGTR